MLHEFLVKNRQSILALARAKAFLISDDKPTSDESEGGLPRFYDRLVRELEREAGGLPRRSASELGGDSPASHGRELLRLGYTVSQVVHAYEILSQAVTERAQVTRTAISASEFTSLNRCVDVAIAEAVAAFSEDAGEDVDSNKRMGFLVHELRNGLTAAILAHAMVRKGVVGAGGSTDALLERNLNRMQDILDRSLAEVRMRNKGAVDRRTVAIIKIAEEVEATAGVEARRRGQILKVAVDPGLQVVGDPHYLISALSNLVQNAIKYTKEDGRICVRGRKVDDAAVIEVEDECGGLPRGKAERLFQPFTQKSADRTGLGLGLTISREAVARNGGTISVRNLPGRGCIFSITLPRRKHRRSRARRPGRRH